MGQIVQDDDFQIAAKRIRLDCEHEPFNAVISSLKKGSTEFYIQNVKYFKNLTCLSNGEWRYNNIQFGTSQRAHFSLNSLIRLLDKNGFVVTSIRQDIKTPLDLESEKLSELKCGRLTLKRENFSQSEWHEFFIQGYVVTVESKPAKKDQRDEMSVKISTLPTPGIEEAERLIESKEYDMALSLLISLIERDPKSWRALNAMGLVAWYKGLAGDAYMWFLKALEQEPTSLDLLINFADAGLAIGKVDDVLKALDRALNIDPSMRQIKIIADKIRLEQKLGFHSNSFDKIVTSRDLNIAAENLIKEGMIDKAQEILKKILSIDHRDFVAQNNMGLVLWYKGWTEDAFDAFYGSLQINPAFGDALVNIFDAALRLKRVHEIVPLIRRALEIDPNLKDAQLLDQEIAKRGEKIYEKSNFGTLLDDSTPMHEGYRFLDELKLGEAALKFLESLEKNEHCARSYNGLGIIAYYWGMFEEAFAFFNKSLDISPLNENTLLNLYDTERELGSARISKKRMENALTIDPSLSKVKEILQQMEP